MGTKMSLVLLYLRIWTADSVTPAFRIACWTLIAILASTAAAGAFAIIFQCTPVSYAWLSITGEIQGKCIRIGAFTYTFGALNICYDVIVFFLPVHSLLKLRITWPRKVGVIGAFLVGFWVTICSIVRLQYLVRIDDSQNITWDFQYIGMWSLVEANFSVVCCCMPAMAGLAQRIYAWYWDSELTFSDDPREAMKDLETNTTDSSQHRGSNTGRVTDVEMMAQKAAYHARGDMDDEMGISTGIDHHAVISAIMYRDRPNARNVVNISHIPPNQASRTLLRYRDQHDILHEVEIIDRPQARMSGREIADLEQAQLDNDPLPEAKWQRAEWELCERDTSRAPSPRMQRFPDL